VAGVIDGSVSVGTAGVTDAENGGPVLPGTRFRPGSITKLLTASLVVRCVTDAGISLDDPVTRFLSGPWRGDLLVRHLISHTSGLDAGDLFLDTGDEDNCIARYVERLATAGFLFPPGATFSYCNGGFALAGRITEVVLGQPWDQALRSNLLGPAAMADTDFVTGRMPKKI
jgi:CubicO group peptidase (beta-lactamase class C family)